MTGMWCSIYASGFRRRCVCPDFYDSFNLWPQLFWLLEKGSSAKFSLADVFLAVFQILHVLSAVQMPSTFSLGFWSVCLSQGLQKVTEAVSCGVLREEDGAKSGPGHLSLSALQLSQPLASSHFQGCFDRGFPFPGCSSSLEVSHVIGLFLKTGHL